MDTIQLTEQSLKQLKKQYDKAIEDKQEVFTFQGHELLVSYAKYLIEYAETQFKTK